MVNIEDIHSPQPAISRHFPPRGLPCQPFDKAGGTGFMSVFMATGKTFSVIKRFLIMNNFNSMPRRFFIPCLRIEIVTKRSLFSLLAADAGDQFLGGCGKGGVWVGGRLDLRLDDDAIVEMDELSRSVIIAGGVDLG